MQTAHLAASSVRHAPRRRSAPVVVVGVHGLAALEAQHAAEAPAAGAASAQNKPTSNIPACDNSGGMGLSRIVEIDTTGGPGFGFEHFKQYDFLRDKEVVLTFDDGPWPKNTPAVLKALTEECLKATFFEIGEHSLASRNNQTSHRSWDNSRHAHLGTQGPREKSLRERSRAGEAGNRDGQQRRAYGRSRRAGLPFPRPTTYAGASVLSRRAQHGGFLDRRRLLRLQDAETRPDQVVKSVMTKLEKHDKGIILMHDFQHATAEALPELTSQLKAGGYKVVHMVPRQPLTTLPKYDEMVKHQDKLSSNNTRPETSVVRTIGQ